MKGPVEIPPSRSANWLAEIMASARDRNACLQPDCTTCGALPFRKTLWASAEAASLGRAAHAIADQLTKLGPPIDVKGIQFVLWELNRTIGRKEMSDLAVGFAKSHSGDVYRRMLEHEEGILAKRKEHELRNDPIEVERRRAEKKAEKARQHSARLAAKAERDSKRMKDP
jgi:hypothetical protein